MSYHNTGSAPSNRTAQQQETYNQPIAPLGFHYMPDGTLMADADMLSDTSDKKVISGIDLDLSPLKASTSARSFGITGDDGAVFNLEVKNGDSNYYNFVTNVFQVNKTGL